MVDKIPNDICNTIKSYTTDSCRINVLKILHKAM